MGSRFLFRGEELFREGFEGTDLATLAHLERPASATGILGNTKEEIALQYFFFVSTHISIQQVDVYMPIYKIRALSDSFFILCCGERGIRTPGASQLNGFQDRRNRPLCHLSFVATGLQEETRSASLVCHHCSS